MRKSFGPRTSIFSKSSAAGKVAVDGVSFSAAKGEILALLGPNGAGKSTLIKMMTGILHPTSGTATIASFIPWKNRKQYTQNIGLVMGQKSLLYWDIPVKDSFHLCKAIYGLSEDTYTRNFQRLDELFGLTEILDVPVRKLSLGLRMKCELSAAMLHMPSILFLDEPTIGLDVKTRAQLLQFLKRLRNETQTTIVLATHNLQEVDYLADRIVLLNHGRVCFDGAVAKMTSILNEKTILIRRSQIKNTSLWKEICSEHELNADEIEQGITVNHSLVAKEIGRILEAIEVESIQIKEPKLEDALMEYLK